MRVLMMLVVGVGVVGCAEKRALTESSEAASRMQEECLARLPPRPTAPRAACFTEANAAYWKTLPDGDLFRAAASENQAIAARFDRGEIAREDAIAMRDRSVARLKTELQMRAAMRNSAAPVSCYTTGPMTNCY